MRTLYFCPVTSFFPRLISAVADWMSTIFLHMVWPYCEFRTQVWNVQHVARWICRTQKIAKNSPSAQHRTTLSGHIFATKTCIDNRKTNSLNSNISSTCPHNIFFFLLWSPYGIGQAIIFSCCSLFFLLFFIPRLISAAADWMSAILPHMVWS